MSFHYPSTLPTSSLFPAPPPVVLDDNLFSSSTSNSLSPITFKSVSLSPQTELPICPTITPDLPPTIPTRHSTTPHKAPAYLRDFHCKMATASTLSLQSLPFPLSLLFHITISLPLIKS